MKRLLMVLFGLFLFINLSGCGNREKLPIKISVKKIIKHISNFSIVHYDILVTSVTDNIKIKNVIVNKGNCKMDPPYRKTKFPVKLKYGEVAKFWYPGSCNIIRVDVVTDHGKWTVKNE